MIDIELKTKIGTFTFKANDKKIIRKINSMKVFKFVNSDGKSITLFNNILESAEASVIL